MRPDPSYLSSKFAARARCAACDATTPFELPGSQKHANPTHTYLL